MNDLIPISVGQIWDHMVYGKIEILEERKDCNNNEWYIARQWATNRLVAVMPRLDLPVGNRFLTLYQY